jgi:hypothetical protein
MDSSKLSEMRSDYKNLKAVFFDEVSLMGKAMLSFVESAASSVYWEEPIYGRATCDILWVFCSN